MNGLALMRKAVVAGCAIALSTVNVVCGGNKVWSNTSGDCKWNTANNWSPNVVAGGSDDAYFGIVGGICTAATTTCYAQGLYFTNTSFTIPNSVELHTGTDGINVTATGAVATLITQSSYLKLDADQSWCVTNNATLIVTNPTSTAYIYMSHNIHKTGSGTAQILSGASGCYNQLVLGLYVDQGIFLVNVYNSEPLLSALTAQPGAEFRVSHIGTAFLRLNNAADCTFSGLFSGAIGTAYNTGFQKWGRGAFRLAGPGRYANAGCFWLKCGPLVLDYTGTGNYNVDKFSDTANFYLGDGVLEVDGASDGPVAESLGSSLCLGLTGGQTDEGGLAIIQVKPGTQNTTLTFPDPSGTLFYLSGGNPRGAMLRFLGVDGVSNRVMFADQTVAPSGILGGLAHVIRNGAVDFAAYNHTGSGGQTGVFQLAESGRPTIFAAGTNTLLSWSTNLASTATTYSLKVKGARTVNLAGKTLTLDSGGLLLTGSPGDVATISNGTLNVGSLASGKTTGYLFVHADADLVLDCAISGLYTGPGGVSKSGAGKLTFTANATMNPNYNIRWFEGSLDYESASNVSLYASGEGYGPNSAMISNTGMLTKAGSGTMSLYTPLCTAGVNINAGVLAIGASGTYQTPGLQLGTGNGSNAVINIASGAKLWYPADYTHTATDMRGNGTVTFNTVVDGSGTKKTLTSAGGVWMPGTNGVGLLAMDGHLTWALNATTTSVLSVGITGSGTTAGVDYGRLAVTGTNLGFNAAAASSAVDLLVNVKPGLSGIGGNTYTILSAMNNFSGQQFHKVTWQTPGTTGTVNYLNGSITLTGVKSPAVGSTIFFR